MKVPLIFLLLLSSQVNAQDIWSVKPNIQFEQFSTYDGLIDGKYSISMYLKESYKPCKSGGFRYTPRIVYGWYMYQKVGEKIPLVGHVCYADACEYSLKLFVPENIFDYSFNDNCDILNAKEVFEQHQGQSTMTWRMGDKKPLPVDLNVEHKFSWTSKADLIISINEIEVNSLNMNEITDEKYIENIDVLGQKVMNGYFHLIVKYSYQSNPGSFGRGNCGAGLEEFIGYMKIDNSFEVKSFDKIQINSCLNNIFDLEVEYDLEYPELGIRKN